MSKTFAVYEGLTLVGTWWGIIGMMLGPIYLVTNLIEYARGCFFFARPRV
jgi:hypothetical protein